MEALSLLFALPLMLLNLLGGLVGGIALLVQGEWRLVVGGLAYSFLGPFILSILMIPAMIFLPLTMWAAKRDNMALAVLSAIPNILWTYLIVAVTCVFVFSRMVDGQEGDFFNVLWAYSVTTAPWSFLAQKDRQSGNEKSTTLMFFVQLGAVAMMVATLLDSTDTSVSRLANWFLPFLVLGIVVQLLESWFAVRSARRYGY